MITPQQGYKIDPTNSNQVIRDPNVITSDLLSNSNPLNVQTPPPVPQPDIKNIPTTTPPTPVIKPETSPFITEIETLTSKLLGKESATETKITEKTADFSTALNELNTQIKVHQANALARQEEALKSGETLRYSTGLAGQVARTDAIEAMKLSALAQGMQGNILIATKQAESAINAEFAQTEKDLATARQNILNNYDTFTEKEKKRADAALLALNEKDAFIARSKADREQSYKTAVEAAKNGLIDTSLLTKIQNSTPEKALELAAPFLKEKEKPIIKDTEIGGNIIREIINPITGKTISSTNMGAKEKATDTGNVILDADSIMAGTANLQDLPTKDGYRAKVSQELTNRFEKARKSGDIINIMKSSAIYDKEPGDTFLQSMEKTISVLGQLEVLQKNIEGVATGPIVGAFRTKNPWDTKAQTIKAQLNAIVPNLARGVYGEVGVLTDNDIKTYSKTIPNLSSTEDIRNAILYITVDMIKRNIENKIKNQAAGQRDMSGYAEIYKMTQETADGILDFIPGAKKTGEEINPEEAETGTILEFGGLKYKKVGENQYEEI